MGLENSYNLNNFWGSMPVYQPLPAFNFMSFMPIWSILPAQQWPPIQFPLSFKPLKFDTFELKSSPLSSNIATTGKQARVTENRVKNAKNLGPEFLEKVKEVAQRVNCNYKDLLALMNSESGLNHKIENKLGYTGLIQFGKSAIAELNKRYGLSLTKEKLKAMSAVEQMNIVETYLLMTKSWNFSSDKKLSAGELYALVFMPGRAKKQVLAQSGEDAYTYNKGLGRNGQITKDTLAAHLDTKYVDQSMFA